MPQVHDRVEDRSTYAGCGHILYVTRGEARVRFDDGSEEAIALDLFDEQAEGFWTV